MQWNISILLLQKKFDDDCYIGLITNYKGDLWHVQYDNGDEDDFNVIEVREGIQLYNSLKNNKLCILN